MKILIALLAVSSVAFAEDKPLKKGVSTPREVFIASGPSGEDWKGQPEDSDLTLGALAGWAGGTQVPGFVLLGTASKKIVKHGFVPDVNNTVSVEAQVGPMWAGGASFLNVSTHLRWDFQKDEHWSFYGLGGLGFNTGSGVFDLYPRVGLGVFYDMAKSFVVRAEFSREVVGVGFVFPLWF